jgi:hypothetical protein
MTTRTQGMMLGQLCMSTVYVSFMVELTTVYLSFMVGHGSSASINSIRRASLDDSARQTAHPIGLCLGEGQQVIARPLGVCSASDVAAGWVPTTVTAAA